MCNHSMVVDKSYQYAQSTVEIFGPKRCIFGANFALDKLNIRYAKLLAIWQDLLGQYSNEEAQYGRQLTAENFYQIEE
jgi:predicted TIM-barrel fold metal-dependent hydrolase